MIRVFVGGSRRISRLPEEAQARLKNVMDRGHKARRVATSGIKLPSLQTLAMRWRETLRGPFRRYSA